MANIAKRLKISKYNCALAMVGYLLLRTELGMVIAARFFWASHRDCTSRIVNNLWNPEKKPVGLICDRGALACFENT